MSTQGSMPLKNLQITRAQIGEKGKPTHEVTTN
jgi:hypothetical protein